MDDALKSAVAEAEKTRDQAQKAAENIASVPGKIGERAAKAAEDVASAPQKIQDALSTDDGKVLDTSSAAGTVGALAVSLAVIPYIPLSLYSSYTLVTTGSGLPAGPNGIYGLAEGLATLTVILVSVWSLVSLVTRARGLPEGPLNLLAVAQAGSYLAVATFAGATYLTTGDTPNPFKGATPQTIVSKATGAINTEATKVQKELEGQVSKASVPLKAAVDEKVSEAQASQSTFFSQLQGQLDKTISGAQEAASKAISQATEKAADKEEKKDVKEKTQEKVKEEKAEGKEEAKKEEKTEAQKEEKKVEKKEAKSTASFEDLFAD